MEQILLLRDGEATSTLTCLVSAPHTVNIGLKEKYLVKYGFEGNVSSKQQSTILQCL